MVLASRARGNRASPKGRRRRPTGPRTPGRRRGPRHDGTRSDPLLAGGCDHDSRRHVRVRAGVAAPPHEEGFPLEHRSAAASRSTSRSVPRTTSGRSSSRSPSSWTGSSRSPRQRHRKPLGGQGRRGRAASSTPRSPSRRRTSSSPGAAPAATPAATAVASCSPRVSPARVDPDQHRARVGAGGHRREGRRRLRLRPASGRQVGPRVQAVHRSRGAETGEWRGDVSGGTTV